MRERHRLQPVSVSTTKRANTRKMEWGKESFPLWDAWRWEGVEKKKQEKQGVRWKTFWYFFSSVTVLDLCSIGRKAQILPSLGFWFWFKDSFLSLETLKLSGESLCQWYQNCLKLPTGVSIPPVGNIVKGREPKDNWRQVAGRPTHMVSLE